MSANTDAITRYLIMLGAAVLGAALGYGISFVSGVNSSYVPVVTTMVGLVGAFSVPLWLALFVNAPRLSVEITAIKRTFNDAAIISIDDDPELRSLMASPRDSIFPSFLGDDSDPVIRGTGGGGNKAGFTLAQTEELLSTAKQRLRDLPAHIEERKKEFDRVNSLTAATLTKYECDRLNGPIHPEVDFDPVDPQKTLDALRDVYQKRLETVEKRFADLQSNLPVVERRIEFLKSDLFNNRSYIAVSASLINSGRSNSAIKVPALLRVSIGEGNYIDLKLTLKDFEEKSEISANGTRIVIFESSEVSSLPEEDRKLINTYWGQSVSSRLYLEDIHSKIHFSNTIAFAEGLYQKIIYDRLARAASTGIRQLGQ